MLARVRLLYGAYADDLCCGDVNSLPFFLIGFRLDVLRMRIDCSECSCGPGRHDV